MVTSAQNSFEQNDWSQCKGPCKCKWVSGRKTADCGEAKLVSIPDNLSPEIQTVDLNGNNLGSLSSEAFKSVGLIHLHKIYLKNCKIESVDKDAFKGLKILIEIDLSDNRIHTLHPGTFKDNVKLRIFIFNRNPITRLEDELFSNLLYLQNVEMSGCSLSQVGLTTFSNVPNLLHLDINGNNLSNIKLATVEHLEKLRSLVLHNNPWNCDCHLRSFRDWIIDRNLFSQPTECAEPIHVQDKLWNAISPNDFACKPHIIWPTADLVINSEREAVNLGCQVSGDPPPDVYWVFNSNYSNSRIIANNSRATYGDHRYSVQTRESENDSKWVNLTISKLLPQDNGEFTCVAKNPGGIDSRNLTLLIKAHGTTFDNDKLPSDSLPLTIGLITGFVALLILIIILCFCFCQRKGRGPRKKSSSNIASSNTDISSGKNLPGEQEKRLLTILNPLDKSGRGHGKSSSPINEGTELLEVKQVFNEDASTLVSSGGDMDRSMDSLPTLTLRSKGDKLEPYPPDLIAFPGRAAAMSPGAVSSSNILDSRMRPHMGPQSPMNNSMLYCFGTLPYSRSESPFSPVSSVVMPRQGYVTIPRRPRVPSWSSAPTPTLLDDRLSPLKVEPVYDNLGPRTTVDGSSAISLNKDPIPDQKKRNNASPHHFPIFDVRDKISHLPHPTPLNESVAPDSSNLSNLKRVSSADSSINGDSYSPLTPKCKIAPKPPPKPNKNVTLYEDETEDGTEV